MVRTIWGELAWQFGGKQAFARIKEDDERATNPGDAIRELLNDYGPALILIDEWVAYARQLHDQSDLPGGGFETQFSFAQALTESVKLAKNCMLVVSLPASDAVASPHAHLEDIEVGGGADARRWSGCVTSSGMSSRRGGLPQLKKDSKLSGGAYLNHSSTLINSNSGTWSRGHFMTPIGRNPGSFRRMRVSPTTKSG